MNVALEGLERLRLNGDFTYTRTIEDTRSKYLLMSNPTMTFVEECCEFSSWANITKEDLYQGFLKFCSDHNLPGLNKKAFGHKIKRACMLTEEHDSWRGIELKKDK